MTQQIRPSEPLPLVQQVLEDIRKDPMYQELRPSAQGSVERGIEQRLMSLTSDRSVLTPYEKADEIKRYVTKGAQAFLKDMWKGQREMKDLVEQIKAERADRRTSDGREP